ncbi:DUF6442 family protein [Lacticigenium naphthae]|uniref:DUF6442 family protein n=1 Tax=Lacticigenium naphthae TaxID=515351 RepID=UPI00041B4681|nr:DUF6442 family protein [Lacticigenium naphthae]
MDKKDILNKARKEMSDEREEQVRLTSFRIGWLSVSAIMIVLIGLRAYFNESASDILMILMAQTAASSFYQYRLLEKNKGYLVAGILSTLAVLLSFATLLSNYGLY